MIIKKTPVSQRPGKRERERKKGRKEGSSETWRGRERRVENSLNSDQMKDAVSHPASCAKLAALERNRNRKTVACLRLVNLLHGRYFDGGTYSYVRASCRW